MSKMAENENDSDRKKRAGKILKGLQKLYPEANCALHHKNPFQLLISTILSAQSTDETINKITPVLFTEHGTPKTLAAAPREKIEQLIHASGFFHQKAKSIQGAAQAIVDDFGGNVPETIEDLITLPGVARKTANVVMGTAFGKNVGVVVDTHVGRLATRLAMTWRSKNTKDAVKIERDLMEVIPKKHWTYLSHALIFHGRQVCSARKPDCESCSLAKWCPSAGMAESLTNSNSSAICR